MSQPRIIIVGAGFGGLAAAKALKNTPAEILLIDRTNHHLFQPLLYQVATSVLTPGQIATPIRGVLRNQKNTTVIMGEVTGVDKDQKCVIVSDADRQNVPIAYDYLILATGASHSYFGHNEFAEYAPGLKSLADAEAARNKIRYRPASGLADFHSRWRRPHRRGNGRRSRHFRPKHTEI